MQYTICRYCVWYCTPLKVVKLQKITKNDLCNILIQIKIDPIFCKFYDTLAHAGKKNRLRYNVIGIN